LSRYRITCTRGSLAVLAAACVWAGGAHAGGPGDVYNDYAADGVLSCNHSRADLVAVLRSGSLNQYGDPLTLARLKLAVRKQLAGGCRHADGSRRTETGGAGAPSSGGTSNGKKPRSSKDTPGHPRRGSKPSRSSQTAPARAASTGSDSASFFAGRGLIVGILVAALALGGWLTKHALAARD
jgi:hypothetical protein